MRDRGLAAGLESPYHECMDHNRRGDIGPPGAAYPALTKLDDQHQIALTEGAAVGSISGRRLLVRDEVSAIRRPYALGLAARRPSSCGSGAPGEAGPTDAGGHDDRRHHQAHRAF